jgi:hypothetical protein
MVSLSLPCPSPRQMPEYYIKLNNGHFQADRF